MNMNMNAAPGKGDDNNDENRNHGKRKAPPVASAAAGGGANAAEIDAELAHKRRISRCVFCCFLLR